MTEKLINRNPDVLGETPMFSGTRVPVRILMEPRTGRPTVSEGAGR